MVASSSPKNTHVQCFSFALILRLRLQMFVSRSPCGPPYFNSISCFILYVCSTKTSMQRGNARVTSAEKLGTLSKNKLRGITLGIRSIWRIRFLTRNTLLSLYIPFTKQFFLPIYPLFHSVNPFTHYHTIIWWWMMNVSTWKWFPFIYNVFV